MKSGDSTGFDAINSDTVLYVLPQLYKGYRWNCKAGIGVVCECKPLPGHDFEREPLRYNCRIERYVSG